MDRYARMILLASAAAAAGGANAQLAASDFSQGTQGWSIAGNGEEPLAAAGDYIATFDADPADLAFVAPQEFLGDLTLAYRGEISFELLPSVRPFQPSRPAVELTGGTLGPMGTPLILRKELAPPATFLEFSSHRVALNERAGWSVVGEGRTATAEEMRDVLASVADLRIEADSAASTSESIGLRRVRIDRPDVRVVIAAGQSNMSGCAHSNLIAWDFTPRHDLLFWNPLTDAFEPLSDGTSDSSCGHDPAQSHRATHFGPEIGFADTYLDLFEDDLLVLIKFTDGGTSLHVDWVPPGLNPAYPNGGALYNEFYDELDLALGLLDAQGYEYTIDGAIWMQGESDTDRASRADPHEAELAAFIGELRDYAANPAMPFIIGRIFDNGFGFDGVVRDAQVAVANADPHACWVDTDDLTQLDVVHYDEPSTLVLGQRFATAIRRLSTPRGDANLDGVVDVEDVYHWNQSPSDENCDGVIDQADLGVVMAGVRSE